MGHFKNVIELSQLHKFDLEEVGKKAYLFGELKHLGILIPDGFVIIFISNLSVNLIKEIHRAYKKLSGLFRETSVNILTSHLNNKSTTFTNIKGDANLIHKIKTILSSEGEMPIAIIVQKHIKSSQKGKLSNESDLAKKIQKHFYFPQEIDCAVEKGKIYVTNIKPLAKIPKQKAITQNKMYRKILVKGIPLNPGIITGSIRILRNQDYYRVKSHEIAVIPQLNKLLYSKISKAKAVVADSELTSSYDKMEFRKNIKIPTIMGVKNAVKILQNGNIVTVNGINGEIYQGGLL